MAEISKTTDQALALLLAIAERQPVSGAELSRSLRMNRTVTQRLLATLHERGFVRRDGDDYQIGATALWVARQAAPSLRATAAPVMEQLASRTGETTVLQVLDGDQLVILDQRIGTRHVVRVEQNLIARHPLHLGASGRVLLAYQPERTIKRIVSDLPDAEEVTGALDRIRAAGYAISHDELQWGVHCVAAPVLDAGDTAVGVLAVLVPVSRAAHSGELVTAVREAAHTVSSDLAAAAGL